MIVTRIKLVDWMITSGETELRLPERGYVLITGPNGHGKSSFREAVAYARSAETIRKMEPWRRGQEGSIEVEGIDRLGRQFVIRREISAKGKIASQIDGTLQATTTKATEAIEERFGSFDAWVRSSVFTGDGVSSFVDATDLQRKKILESFLGVDKFEPAIKVARADAKLLKERVGAAEKELASLEAELDRIEAERARLRSTTSDSAIDYEKALADCDRQIGAYEEDIAELVEREQTVRQSITTLRDSIEELRVQQASATTALQVLGQRKAKIAEGDCPTCETKITHEHVRSVHHTIDEETTRHEELAQKTTAEIAGLRERLEKLNQIRSKIEGELQSNRAQHRDALDRRSSLKSEQAEHEATRTGVEEQLRRLEIDFQEKDERATEVDQRLEATKAELAANGYAQMALSPSGIRSMLLTRSLAAVERAANRYLTRLFPGVRVKISPSRVQANGAVVEEIDFRVEGAADDRGFDALSTGQRKRVLLAVLMALSTLSRGANGPSTIWLDEALDGLDDEGLDAVCDMVRDVSADVPVVVISHREELLERLARGAQERWHVEKGQAVTRSARTADHGTKRFVEGATTDESDPQPTPQNGTTDQPNGTGRRRGTRRKAEASAPAIDAPPPRAGKPKRAGGRRSARAS